MNEQLGSGLNVYEAKLKEGEAETDRPPLLRFACPPFLLSQESRGGAGKVAGGGNFGGEIPPLTPAEYEGAFPAREQTNWLNQP